MTFSATNKGAQSTLEGGLSQIGVLEGQANVPRQAHIELEAFLVLGLEHTGDVDHLVEHDGVALDLVDVSGHARSRQGPAGRACQRRVVFFLAFFLAAFFRAGADDVLAAGAGFGDAFPP